jgi:diketogulonate reductase-like aldo/keto reductase
VTSVIIGARKMGQLEDNLKAVDIELSADELARLDEVSAPPPQYPGWMVSMPRGTTFAEVLANLS